jgi:hypothetical protein
MIWSRQISNYLKIHFIGIYIIPIVMFITCKYKQSINSKTTRLSFLAWHSIKMVDVKVARFKLRKTIYISYTFKRAYYTIKSYIIHN